MKFFKPWVNWGMSWSTIVPARPRKPDGMNARLPSHAVEANDHLAGGSLDSNTQRGVNTTRAAMNNQDNMALRNKMACKMSGFRPARTDWPAHSFDQVDQLIGVTDGEAIRNFPGMMCLATS